MVEVFVFALVAGMFGALFAKVRFTHPDALEVRRRLAAARIASADELEDGAEATTAGIVRAVVGQPVLRAPLTDTACVYWQLRYVEVGAADEVVRARLQQPGLLLLDTAAGTALVRIDTAVLDVPIHVVERSGPAFFHESSTDLIIIQARATGLRMRHESSILRCVESVIVPGMAVVVSGWCAREPDPDAHASVSGYRDQLPTRPILSGTRRAPLLIGLDRRINPGAART